MSGRNQVKIQLKLRLHYLYNKLSERKKEKPK